VSRAAVLLLAACGSHAQSDATPPPSPPRDAAVAPAVDAAAPAPPAPLTFAVLSDLHLPNPKPDTAKIIAAVIAAHPRFVAIVGDFTNGSDKRDNADPKAWEAVDAALAPIRAAHIPILPVAGNHDSYFAHQRALYAKEFADLAAWTAPLVPHGGDKGLAAAPFSYAVDVDGVHVAMVHLTGGHVDPAVQQWLRDDLAAAHGVKIVMGHVPMISINGARKPNEQLAAVIPGVDAVIMGHEHLVWDEDVPFGHATIHEIVVGCGSGFYNYAPSPASRKRAHCTPTADRVPHEHCTMPHGGGAFDLAKGRKDRMLEHALATYTLVTVGASVEATPMTADGPFYLARK